MDILNDALWQDHDPQSKLHPCQLLDTNSGVGERGICALPFARQSDAETIYFPVNIIGNLLCKQWHVGRK